MQRLREASEKAKVELSSAFETEINLPFLYAKGAEPLHLNVTLTRSKFEQLISPIIERTLAPCRKALSDAKLKTSDVDEILLVGGSTRIPMVQEKVEAFFGKAPNRSVNPDEVVAMGAAVQAGILSGDVKNMVLLDVTLSLGIETMGGISTVLIPRNTTVPAKKTEVFSTAADNQSSVEVVVLQGERKMSHDNRVLARFHLDGIPSAPRGVPQVEVTFDIDVNGVLHAAAKDKATSREQTVTVTDSTGLSDADIDKMVQDAEAHAEEDERQRKHAEARNQLDSAGLRGRTYAERQQGETQRRGGRQGRGGNKERSERSGHGRHGNFGASDPKLEPSDRSHGGGTLCGLGSGRASQ